MKLRMAEMQVRSTLDGSREPCLFWRPANRKRAPLLVGLHTWSNDRFNQVDAMLPLCRERGWALLLPEFRGPNRADNPRARQACASRLAMQDVVDAVAAVRRRFPVEPRNIFLLGGSGGGHMALMLTAYAPKLWRGVDAWVPITDLAAFHGESPNYAPHVEACCGGKPGRSRSVDREYRMRSPLHHVRRLCATPLCAHHGRFDRSVPYTHTLKLALAMEKLGARQFFFDIFDGKHELRYDVAFRWFDRLAEADWTVHALTG